MADYPNLRAARRDAARGAHRDRERLERCLPHAAAFHVGPSLPGLEIFDRVGGGDSFASGLIYGLLEGSTSSGRSTTAWPTAPSR